MAKFCENCGAELNENADVCLNCGKSAAKAKSDTSTGTGVTKSKVAAALLAFFFGTLGVHNFYLGYTGKAVAQLLLTIFGYILSILVIGLFMVAAVAIWAFVEFIMILVGAIKTDAKGNPIV